MNIDTIWVIQKNKKFLASWTFSSQQNRVVSKWSNDIDEARQFDYKQDAINLIFDVGGVVKSVENSLVISNNNEGSLLIDKKFFEFHNKNPKVFELLVFLTKKAKKAGFKKYSIKTILHNIRWRMDIDYNIKKPYGKPYKINNNFSSRYVRLLEKKYPEFIGFFEKRTLKTLTKLRN